MKRYIKSIQKKLLKIKNSRSISRSNDPSSFSSSITSSDSSETQTAYIKPGSATPTSVLQKPTNHETEWMESYITSDSAHALEIGKEELRMLLSKMGGVSEGEIKVMLTEFDRDGDGCIRLEELEGAVGEGELRETFEFFDADHDGKISAEELYSVFETVVGEGGCTLEECRRMISGVDGNGDGFVCFQDFTRMMDVQLRR